MNSVIDQSEVIENKERKFGSNLEYYPTTIIKCNGNKIKALFTKSQINDAINRAEKNPEDMIEKKSFFSKLFS